MHRVSMRSHTDPWRVTNLTPPAMGTAPTNGSEELRRHLWAWCRSTPSSAVPGHRREALNAAQSPSDGLDDVRIGHTWVSHSLYRHGRVNLPRGQLRDMTPHVFGGGATGRDAHQQRRVIGHINRYLGV